jgi:hypothetical protein
VCCCCARQSVCKSHVTRVVVHPLGCFAFCQHFASCLAGLESQLMLYAGFCLAPAHAHSVCERVRPRFFCTNGLHASHPAAAAAVNRADNVYAMTCHAACSSCCWMASCIRVPCAMRAGVGKDRRSTVLSPRAGIESLCCACPSHVFRR